MIGLAARPRRNAQGWRKFRQVLAAYRLCARPAHARIEWAPPGSIWNSNPFDGVGFCHGEHPAKDCKPSKTTDLTIYKVAESCYPWGGNIRCVYIVGVSKSGAGDV